MEFELKKKKNTLYFDVAYTIMLKWILLQTLGLHIECTMNDKHREPVRA